MRRRLRVLYEHPSLGHVPGAVVDEFEGAQAFVDIGAAEWVGDRPAAEAIETADRAGAPEVTARQQTRRRR